MWNKTLTGQYQSEWTIQGNTLSGKVRKTFGIVKGEVYHIVDDFINVTIVYYGSNVDEAKATVMQCIK